MTKITLSRALTLKNRIIGELAKLAEIISKHNSRRSDNEAEYQVKTLMEDYNNKKAQLVKIKSAISKANAPIQEYIFSMAERKDTIQMLRKVECKRGKQHVGVGSYDREVVEMIFVCEYTQAQIDSMISEEQEAIDDLQAKLDHHNATTEIEIEF